ncbi:MULTISPECIES: hypothetical protein [Pseudanabaena]|uniref:Uncharacterized protein n=2 Tax=Pseudanabaena TaxID=1152 RepID=L8N6V3_9CYAN|nr:MULTISPECIES: hypothetical protein [Pseudanabaena]ELS34834.1 hypothetical protein Pse7429DRAFT_0023 [Pseudanabaena biceps PCC 7429]MDG3492956.1 hypothetical protein [Pseudanabaena catenata USMAC16]
MTTKILNSSTNFIITNVDGQSLFAIQSPSIFIESKQHRSGSKRRKHINKNKLVGSISTIPEAIYNSLSVASYTYTEREASSNDGDNILTKFPELNLSEIRLQKLSHQVDTRTLHTTFKLLANLFEISQTTGLWWGLPLINVGFSSEILLEWWHNSKKLDFDILGSNIEYMKVWGADIDEEMEDGSVAINERDLISLWKWISN